MHRYKPPTVKKPIKSGQLNKNLCVKDFNFIKKYNVATIKPLVDAASYLDMRSLQDVCICSLATRYYVEPSIQGVLIAKEKFKIKGDITDERIAEMKRKHPEIEKLRLRKEQEKLSKANGVKQAKKE